MADTMTNTADEPANDQDQDARKNDEHQDQGADGDQADAVTTAETAREAAEKRAAEAEQEAARLRRSNAAQRGTDLDALREEVRGEFTAQLVRAELRAAAVGKLRDPADALALVDVSTFAGKGGDVDVAAVAAAVDQLVKDKPYLAVAETSTAPAWGDVGAGPREDAGEPEPGTPTDRLRRAFTPN